MPRKFDPDRIRQARDEARLTQDELASRIGKKAFQVSNWETGKHQPRLDTVIAIARETGKPLSFFAGDDEAEEYALAAEALGLIRRLAHHDREAVS